MSVKYLIEQLYILILPKFEEFKCIWNFVYHVYGQVCSLGQDRALIIARRFFLCLYAYVIFFFQPFVEKGHAIQRLFPPRMYAVIIPVVAGLVLLGIIGFVAFFSHELV